MGYLLYALRSGNGKDAFTSDDEIDTLEEAEARGREHLNQQGDIDAVRILEIGKYDEVEIHKPVRVLSR